MNTNMKLKEIMSDHANCLSPNTSLKEACAQMQKEDVGFLPVKENSNLVGVVTDRDIAIRGIAKGLDPNATIDKVMTKKVVTALDTDTLDKAIQLMEQKQIRRLAILDKNHSVVGVVSMGDIANKTHNMNLCGTLICALSEKTH